MLSSIAVTVTVWGTFQLPVVNTTWAGDTLKSEVPVRLMVVGATGWLPRAMV